jgi:hypothetical protein
LIYRIIELSFLISFPEVLSFPLRLTLYARGHM